MPLLSCFQARGTCQPEGSHSWCSPGRSVQNGRWYQGKSGKLGFAPNSKHLLSPISGEMLGAGSMGAASFLLPPVPCSHKGEHWLHVGMEQPDGRTSSRKADSVRLWAQFICFKLERRAWPQNTEPNSLVLVQSAEECEWFVAGPSFL